MSRNKLRPASRWLYAGVAMTVLSITMYANILPVFRGRLQEYLRVDNEGFGRMFSVGPLLGIVGVLVGGRLIDWWGPRRIIRAALLGIATGMFLYAAAGDRRWLVTAAIGWGALWATPMVLATDVHLGRLFPRQRRRVLSLNLVFIGVGNALWPLMADCLLQWQAACAIPFDYIFRVPFLVVGALLAAVSFLYRGGKVEHRPSREGVKLRFLASIASNAFNANGEAKFLALLIALHATADGTLYFWMARFLESASFKPGAMLFTPGKVLAAYAAACLLSRLILSAIPSRSGRTWFIFAPGILGGGALICGILSRDYSLTVLGYVLGGFFWALEYPALTSAVMGKDMARYGAVMSFAVTLSLCFTFVTLNAIGALDSKLGDADMWKLMLIPAGMFPLVGVGGALWLLGQKTAAPSIIQCGAGAGRGLAAGRNAA